MYDVGLKGYQKKLRLLAKNEQKAPICAMTEIDGHVMVAIGSKIIMFSFANQTELTGAAFYDAQVYVVSLNVIKNYILVSDVFQSIFFLRWRIQGKQLELLGKKKRQQSSSIFFVH